MRELYRESVAIEREYATKLQALARKASEKKNKKIATLVVGAEPTKAWGEDVLSRRFMSAAGRGEDANEQTTALSTRRGHR